MVSRGRRLCLVCHCILNQNSVLHDWERAEGGFFSVLGEVARRGLGIIQLPCPETRYAGIARPPRTREEYDLPDFRKICGICLGEAMSELAPFFDDGCRVDLILTIGASPTCDPVNGHFCEPLIEALRERNPALKVLAVPPDYEEGEDHPFLDQLRHTLES